MTTNNQGVGTRELALMILLAVYSIAARWMLRA